MWTLGWLFSHPCGLGGLLFSDFGSGLPLTHSPKSYSGVLRKVGGSLVASQHGPTPTCAWNPSTNSRRRANRFILNGHVACGVVSCAAWAASTPSPPEGGTLTSHQVQAYDTISNMARVKRTSRSCFPGSITVKSLYHHTNH